MKDKTVKYQIQKIDHRLITKEILKSDMKEKFRYLQKNGNIINLNKRKTKLKI